MYIGIEILSGVGMAGCNCGHGLIDSFRSRWIQILHPPKKFLKFNRLEPLMSGMLVCMFFRIFLTFIHTLEIPKCEASFQRKIFLSWLFLQHGPKNCIMPKTMSTPSQGGHHKPTVERSGKIRGWGQMGTGEAPWRYSHWGEQTSALWETRQTLSACSLVAYSSILDGSWWLLEPSRMLE